MSGAISASTIIGAVGAAGSVASIGMGIAGAAQQSAAQRQAGEIAYQNALARQAALENEALQREAQAKEAQAVAQRRGIEEDRKGHILASRAVAAMASSGAGVDPNLVAGLLAEGDYAKDVALYEGDARAQTLNYQAKLNRYEGATGVAMGRRTQGVMNDRADSTMTYGIAGGIAQGLTLAGKYAPGPAPGITAAAPPSGGYSAGMLDINANNYGRLAERP